MSGVLTDGMHDDAARWNRRRLLGAVGAGATTLLAGCADTDGRSAVDVTGESPCVDGVTVTEEAVRIATGEVPEVRLRLRNAGSEPVDYEVRVVFLQGTSLGIDARTGRAVVSGTLAPGETTVEVVTDDARDVRNTDTYDLDVSVVCTAS